MCGDDGDHPTLSGEGKGFLVAARIVLADAGERLILVTDKDGWPDVAAGLGLHLYRPAQQGLEPRIFQHDADGAGQRGIGAGGHIEGEDLPALDEDIEGRQVAGFDRRGDRVVLVDRVAGVVSGRRGAGRRRAKDAGHARQIEHAEEHGDALHDARPDLVVEGVPVVFVPAIDGFHAEPDLHRRRVLDPLTLIRDRVGVQVVYHGLIGVRPLVVGARRVRSKPDGFQRDNLRLVAYVAGLYGDPHVAPIARECVRLFNLRCEEFFVDGAVVHVSKRHPSGLGAAVARMGKHAVQLDNPADEIRVRLLPEWFFPFAEQLVEQGRHGIGERVRIKPRRAQRVPRQPAIEGQLDVVAFASNLGEYAADVVTEIALHFQDERGRSPCGIRGLPAQELARERVHTGGGLAAADGAENRHAGIESTLGDDQPFGGRALDGSNRVMDLPDDDRRAVRRRRKWPRGKAGPEPETDAHPGEPDPRRADEKLAGEEHGHAGRDVVPDDDRRVIVRRVVADEDGHGIGLGKHAGPRPRGHGTDTADDEEGA